ncbi:hypothetical protein K490DRAFT_55455 [Saccharata proteae CBS 121410]|uniref:Secreted protein n=1 Tax=Saccharata proteae CBS 121410 TaxID=1314787 RepID=A0A6A5YAF9_9PEZI|nr:hypothetical protein K490DRAFT_55455 [Saccharata proteae CBS 121410]
MAFWAIGPLAVQLALSASALECNNGNQHISCQPSLRVIVLVRGASQPTTQPDVQRQRWGTRRDYPAERASTAADRSFMMCRCIRIPHDALVEKHPSRRVQQSWRRRAGSKRAGHGILARERMMSGGVRSSETTGRRQHSTSRRVGRRCARRICFGADCGDGALYQRQALDASR